MESKVIIRESLMVTSSFTWHLRDGTNPGRIIFRKPAT